MGKPKANTYRLILGLSIIVLMFSGCPLSSTDKPYSSSAKSKEVSDLLDKENYEAAKILLKSYIPQAPNDSGLYCQYVRLMVSHYDIENDPNLSTPLFPPNGEASATRIIEEASRIAVQLEPKNKAWIANTILRELLLQVQNRAEKGEGYINYASPGLIRAAWTAIEIDGETSKNWVDEYKSLIPIFVKSGKVVSAMFTGNLEGDLSGGKKNNGQDFKEATKALKLAVESPHSTLEITSNAWELYKNLFGKRIEQALENKESDYLELLRAMKAKNYKFTMYNDKQYLPVDLQPTPIPTPTPYQIVPVSTPTPTPSPSPTSTPDSRIYLRVTAKNLNLRSEPNLKNAPVLEIGYGEWLYLLPPTDCRTCYKDGKWFYVFHINSGRKGWISKDSNGESTFYFED